MPATLSLGGSAPGGPSAAVRRFDPRTGPPLGSRTVRRPRTDGAVATAGRTIYLLGGISSGPLASVIAVRPR